MSKRSTTGLPKAGTGKPNTPDTAAAKPSGILQQLRLREYHTKHEREAAIQRLVILGTGVALAIALVILVFAFVVDQFIRPGQSVASINGETITVADFRSRAKLERALLGEQINQQIAMMASFDMDSDTIVQQISNQPPFSTWLSELSVPDQLGNRVLTEMIEDELVRQKASELGITVSDEELQEEINEFFGYDPNVGVVEPTASPTATSSPTPVVSPTPSQVPTATHTPTVTPTPEVEPTATTTPVPSATPSATPNAEERAQQYNETRTSFFDAVLSSAGISQEVLNDYFEMRVLRTKVRDAVLTDVPKTDTFINARHILVATQEEAQQVVDALNAGESFAALAAALSTDGSAQQGGELGWAQPSRYVTEFADAITGAAVGTFVGPVQTQFGFHVIQVLGREERDITDAQHETKLNDEFTTYVENLRSAESTNVEIFDIWADNVPEEPAFVARGL